MAEFPPREFSKADMRLFQTIEMTKSDEYTTPPPSTDFEELEVVPKQESIYSWKVVNRRLRRRRYTFSHGAPPAPPSTPTASGTPTPTPSASSTLCREDERFGSLLYILDYVPKYKNKLKDQQRTDAELAELFNIVTITGGTATSYVSDSKLKSERGISTASRTIRKQDAVKKIFKIHRNPQVSRDPDEEDSISAPEYDTEEDDLLYRCIRRNTASQLKRQRRFARFEHQERMDAVLDTFDAAMTFNDV